MVERTFASMDSVKHFLQSRSPEVLPVEEGFTGFADGANWRIHQLFTAYCLVCIK